jgi:Flp pilus assembly protein TadG
MNFKNTFGSWNGSRAPSRPARTPGVLGVLTSSDRGSVTLLLAVWVVAIVAVIGLAVDGGAKVRAIQRADNIAAEAARAAGQAIDPTLAVPGTDQVLEINQAKAAGDAYLRAAGVQGVVTVVGNTEVQVSVTITTNTVMLSMIGINTTTANGHAVAQLVVR